MNEIKEVMKETKEYYFSFVGGGWNSVYASSESQAIKSALMTWKDLRSEVDVNSFRLATKPDKDQLLSTFW